MEEYISQEGLENLKEKLKYLEEVKRKEIAENLREAAALGDISENAQYHEAKMEQSFLEGRIVELKDAINKAVVVKEVKKGVVGVGSKIMVETREEKTQMRISGGQESDPLNGIISCQSPLGKALLGKQEGDSVEYESPLGKMKAKILKIE